MGDSARGEGVRSEGVWDDEEEVGFEAKHSDDVGVFSEGEREEGGIEGGRETDGYRHCSPIASAKVRRREGEDGEEEEEEEEEGEEERGGEDGKGKNVGEKEEREGGGEERERGHRTKLKRTPSDIAVRKAQLLSVAGNLNNRETGQRNVTLMSASGVSKQKVSKMRQRFQNAGGRKEGGRREGGKRGGGRGEVSKLVLERAELFRGKGGDGGGGRGGGGGGGRKGGGGGGVRRGRGGGRGGRVESWYVFADTADEGAMETLQEIAGGERGGGRRGERGGEGGGGGGEGTIPSPSSPLFERPMLDFPIFSSPFASSPWQPTFLRNQSISPFSLATDDNGENNEPPIEGFPSKEEGSDSSSEEDLMAALTPTTGKSAISPIGRSWLSPGRPHTLGIPHLVRGGNITGVKEKSPFFNEPYQRQRGQQLFSTSSITAAATRLSVIPEETASACGSISDVARATD